MNKAEEIRELMSPKHEEEFIGEYRGGMGEILSCIYREALKYNKYSMRLPRKYDKYSNELKEMGFKVGYTNLYGSDSFYINWEEGKHYD